MGNDIQPPKRRAATMPVAKPAATKPAPSYDDDVVIDEDGKIEQPEPKAAAKEPAGKPSTAAAGGNFITRGWHRFKIWWHGLDRKWQILFAVLAVLVVCALAYGVHKITEPKVAPATKVTKSTPKSDLVASPLSGVQVTKQAASRPVTGIMIENSTFARPQSGLQDAGIVYEAIAEAGITRFLALFQDTAPQYIGPVRSLRPYYIDYAAPFQASIVHVGGSPDALSEVEDGNYRNLDQFFNGGAFTRVSSRDAPHNVYTSFAQLDQLNQSKGYTSSTYTKWPRKADKKLATPTAKTIDLAISSGDYHVHYDYDPTTNSYARSEGGAAHMDLVSASDTTGVQLKPKVVIGMVVPLSQGALDASGAYYSEYQTAGSGVAYVFQDGGVTQGTWTKAGTTGQVQFTDAAGHELKLNAGQTWVTLLGDAGQATYAP